MPVAGAGTRLKPHTNTFPKVLLTVGHKPILGHIIDQLIEIGTPHIRLVTGYMGAKIQEYMKRAYPELDVTYIDQPQPRGLGHAVWLALKDLHGPVFILLGDTILDADLNRFVAFKEDCIGVREVKDPRRFGVVEMRDGYVSSLVEKPAHPASNLAIVGAYSFCDCAALHASLDEIVNSGKTTAGEIQLTDALVNLVRNGAKIRPIPADGWHDCGKPSTLLETNRHLLDKHKKDLSVERPGNLIIAPVYIAKTAHVEQSIIGPNVSIGEGAHISASIISDSIINTGAHLRCAALEKSLVGPNAVLVGHKQQINIGENCEIYLDSTTEIAD